MEGILKKMFFSKTKMKSEGISIVSNLSEGRVNKEYRVTCVKSNDEELEKFLFSLGCYEGEKVTLISVLGDTYVINIKEARYSIDKPLALAIKVEEI